MPFFRIKIVGHSMEPTLKDGDVVWIFKWAYLILSPKIGDIVVFKKGVKFFVKRIISKEKEDYILEGDNNSDSLDSRRLGLINRKSIIGKVLNL